MATKAFDLQLAKLSRAIYNKRSKFDKEASQYGYRVRTYVSHNYSVGAICEADNHIVLVCQGTDFFRSFKGTLVDFLSNINLFPRLWAGEGIVHSGYSSSFNRIRYQLREAIRDVPEDKRIILTGHSLGGVCSLLYGAWVMSNTTDHHPIHLIVLFGAPRCGSSKTYDPLKNSVDIRRYSVKLDPASTFGIPYVHPCPSIDLEAPWCKCKFIERHYMDTYIEALENN